MRIAAYLSLILICFGLNSCSNDPKKELIGKWKLVNIDYSRHLETIEPKLREEFISMSEGQKQHVLNKTFFEFSENGILQIEAPKYKGGNAILSGTWALSAQNDSILLDYGEIEIYAFQFDDEQKLVLESSDVPLRINTLVKE